MSDTNQEQAVEPSEPSTETEPSTEEAKPFTIDDVDRRFFSPEDLTDAQKAVDQVQEHVPAKMVQWNFNPEKDEVPSGYGLAIVPISQRKLGGEGNETIGVVIAAVPDPSLIAGHEKGPEFIREVITDFFLAKVANAARPKASGTSTLPFSIIDYIERRRGRESLKVFTELAPIYVKALREKGLKMLTQALLRQILQSKVFAEQFNRKLEAKGFWSGVLDKMVEKAKVKGLDPAVLVNWHDTRELAEAIDIDDLDVDELDELVG